MTSWFNWKKKADFAARFADQRVGAAPGSFLPHTHIREGSTVSTKCERKKGFADWANRAIKAAEGSERRVRAGIQVGRTHRLPHLRQRQVVQGATRGNGVTGDGVYEQLLTVRSIPRTIPFKGKMEVQGDASCASPCSKSEQDSR
ncbi:MAG: hypothetical protein R2881_06310 [Eubacteriales bacterium]